MFVSALTFIRHEKFAFAALFASRPFPNINTSWSLLPRDGSRGLVTASWKPYTKLLTPYLE